MSDTRPRFVKVPEGWLCNLGEFERSIRPPPHDCPDCQTGYYTESEQPSTYVKALQESRKHITNRLGSYADPLMSRWRKRSQEKRRELLHKAVPELEESQWINSRYVYSDEKFRYGERTVQRRRQLLVPRLNVEVLKTSPAILFALLHYRTLYPPEDFAPLDCRQMELSWAYGYFDVELSAKRVVMSGPRITDEILEGANAADASAKTDRWRDLTSIGFRHPGETELWSPYTNPAFSRPPKLNMGCMVSMAQTRKEEAIDHLIDLQCDPAYLRRHINGLFSNTLFRVLDTEDAAMMVARYIHTEYTRYYWWYWIEIECKHVRGLHDRFSDSTHPGQPIPPKYDRALGALELLLVTQALERIHRFKSLMPWVARGLSWDSNPNTKKALENDPLDWCPHQMMGKPDDYKHFDHAMIFAMIDDHLVKNNRKEAARIDEFLMREMADISALHHSNQEFKKMGKALVDGFYEGKAPSGAKNKAWLQQSQTMQGFVEGFFKKLENLFRKDPEGISLEAETIEEFLSDVLVQNEPEYLEAIASEEEEIMTQITKAKKTAPTPF
ncbi:uncharacterized protein CCOS01_16327 [Colletotrichum costaricense]|uniref:Uncharacterized protein n=1 Tax=Colletotrichum costaricense TaxID=1209916 RepID=A0AAI9YFY0_9PEZI|nr:uncharacterized protein CCOS01_16327 [Colletotrichum costaricense]KAK1507068.1 hypothetical protein CCOS01_16327 [Colletotrichum costaricense]